MVTELYQINEYFPLAAGEHHRTLQIVVSLLKAL